MKRRVFEDDFIQVQNSMQKLVASFPPYDPKSLVILNVVTELARETK